MSKQDKEPTTKSLSHEAKTHLTVIYGYLQLLQSSLQNSNADKQNLDKIVNKTLNSCNELSSLLETLDSKLSIDNN